jgi:hypothetical protein
MARRRKRRPARGPKTPASAQQAARLASALLVMAHTIATIKSLSSHARQGVAAPPVILDDCANKLAECFQVFRQAHERPTTAK